MNKDDISLFKVIRTSMKYFLTKCPIYGVFVIIVGCMLSVGLGVNTTITQKFFDCVSNNIGPNGSFKSVIIMAVVLCFFFITTQILNGLLNFMGDDFSKKTIGKVSLILNDKASRIDPICYENPKFLDDINKAEKGLFCSIQCATVIIMIITMYLPYFIYMGVYLYKLKAILVSALFIAFIPVFINQLIKIKMFSKLEDESAPLRREYEYYEKCIMDREYFKETRLLGAFSYFKNIYNNSLKLLDKKIWKTEKKSILMELCMNIFTMISNVIILFLLVTALINREITVGAFGAVLASIKMIFNMLDEVISRHIGQITREIGTIKNFIRFLELPERDGEEICIEKIPRIVVNNINFSYPGADKKALDNISLEILSGQTVAIVGENGSGKTTLVKLLTGLYLPNEGEVLIEGHNTKDILLKSLYNSMSGVFQKFQRYKMTLHDNISISEIKGTVHSNIPNYDESYRIKEALEKADLEVEEDKFPNGYETMLSREFDGVDLSGGQWQRIAIARGFYKTHNMIVLDEPTAAIDPVEETKIYNKFKEISMNKTSILVTHRLGSTKIADKIIVMDKGKLVEIGTHEELMNNHGKYADMYESQSKWYESKVEAGK